MCKSYRDEEIFVMSPIITVDSKSENVYAGGEKKSILVKEISMAAQRTFITDLLKFHLKFSSIVAQI